MSNATPTPSPDDSDHAVLARWAADCAEHVLSAYAAKYPDDDRPQRAIDAGRAWADGTLKVGLARAATISAHDAARAATDPAAIAAARAAGHAAAVPHMCAHAQHAAEYAVQSVAATTSSDSASAPHERDWQLGLLPERLRERAFHLEEEQTARSARG